MCTEVDEWYDWSSRHSCSRPSYQREPMHAAQTDYCRIQRMPQRRSHFRLYLPLLYLKVRWFGQMLKFRTWSLTPRLTHVLLAYFLVLDGYCYSILALTCRLSKYTPRDCGLCWVTTVHSLYSKVASGVCQFHESWQWLIYIGLGLFWYCLAIQAPALEMWSMQNLGR